MDGNEIDILTHSVIVEELIRKFLTLSVLSMHILPKLSNEFLNVWGALKL